MTIFVLQRKHAVNLREIGVTMRNVKYIGKNIVTMQHDIVKNMINQAKIAHYSSLVEESSGNQKKIFNIVEKLPHKPKTPVIRSTHSDQDLANEFSNLLLKKLRTSVVLSTSTCHSITHTHCRAHIVDSLCLSLLVLRRSRNLS